MRWLVYACATALLAIMLPAQAYVLRTAAQEGTEPKFITDGKGGIVGLCVDLLRAIEQLEPSLIIKGDQVWKPLVRAYSEVEHGLLDPVARERLEQALFQLEKNGTLDRLIRKWD